MNYFACPGISRTPIVNTTLSKRTRISKHEVIAIVAKLCNVTPEDIKSNIRTYDVVEARHIACGVLRDEFDYSLKCIGDAIGNKHHTTVIHSIRTYRDRCKVYDEYRKTADAAIKEIRVRINCQ